MSYSISKHGLYLAALYIFSVAVWLTVSLWILSQACLEAGAINILAKLTSRSEGDLRLNGIWGLMVSQFYQTNFWNLNNDTSVLQMLHLPIWSIWMLHLCSCRSVVLLKISNWLVIVYGNKYSFYFTGLWIDNTIISSVKWRSLVC